MKVYEKPEVVIVEFSILEAVAAIPGMSGGVVNGSGFGLEDEE